MAALKAGMKLPARAQRLAVPARQARILKSVVPRGWFWEKKADAATTTTVVEKKEEASAPPPAEPEKPVEPEMLVPKAFDGEIDEGNIGEFCSLDANGKRVAKKTLPEMEKEFLTALNAWYFEGKPIMTDAEFDLLREELIWNGSKVAVLSKDELTFLQASRAFSKGEPIMAEEDYQALKCELKLRGSVAAAEGARCDLEKKVTFTDCQPEYVRMTLLNVPAVLIVLSTLFALDWYFGFGISAAISGGPYVSVGVLWGIVLPACYVLSSSITNLAFKDNLILKGACPNCAAENMSYFGEFGTVPSNNLNVVTCVCCHSALTFDSDKRIIVINAPPEAEESS